MNNPKVSINIPCYNRKDMLRECLESFIAQTFTDWELIVADDGSEDDLTFITSMDSRIRYYRQPHLGMAKAYNLALDHSIGEYVMPFGSDDIACNDLLEETVALMEKYKRRYDVIYSNHLTIKQNGKIHRVLATKTLREDDAYRAMLERQYIPHGGSLWKRNKIPRYDESLESAVDWELFLTAMENGVKFKHRRAKLWIHRTGHPREEGTSRQTECCHKILNKRGYDFDEKSRRGFKIKNDAVENE